MRTRYAQDEQHGPISFSSTPLTSPFASLGADLPSPAMPQIIMSTGLRNQASSSPSGVRMRTTTCLHHTRSACPRAQRETDHNIPAGPAARSPSGEMVALGFVTIFSPLHILTPVIILCSAQCVKLACESAQTLLRGLHRLSFGVNSLQKIDCERMQSLHLKAPPALESKLHADLLQKSMATLRYEQIWLRSASISRFSVFADLNVSRPKLPR
jgi:hypothetical protein